MSELDIRPRTSDDDERIVGIYNRVHGDWLPMTVDDYRLFIERRPEGVGWEAWVAERDGEIVGSIDFMGVWSAQEPGAWEVYLYVDGEHAGQGIGSTLYRRLEERIGPLDMRRLYVQVREDRPEGLRFAERRGFAPTGHVERFVRLEVAGASLQDLDEREERLRREGVEIVALAEIGLENERFMHALHELYEGAMADMPGSEVHNPREYEHWLDAMLWPGNSPEWCWVAIRRDRDGTPWPVGIARIRRQGDAGVHGFTGVDRAYRGRGIAQALKLRTIRWAQEAGIRSLFAGNDEHNLAMRAINRELGYEPLPGGVELRKTLGT